MDYTMFEPAKSGYFQKKPEKMKVMREPNKAFHSLSFRTKRCAAAATHQAGSNFLRKSIKKQKTYGAILCIKCKSGDDLYALVQGSYTGKWSFPKGHSNEGEHPIECTLREVAEETGIDELPEPSEYVHVGYGKYFIFYLNKQIPLIPRDTHEIMNTKWVTLGEMEKMELNADASLYVRSNKW